MRHSRSSFHVPLVLLLSLLFTYLFFIEYLPPVRAIHIPYDLEGFHYPLNDYAFQSLRQGRLPEWDPTVYCGMSFAGNVQTATFYPPVWLLYLANHRHARLTYLSLEIFVFFHVWLTFVVCYFWLRARGLVPMACVLGAGVLAYSGYMLLQLQHLGLICVFAWIPLGLWGIDESIDTRSWRPLWKLILASTLAFLAGYPPMWVVFAVCMLAYGLFRLPVSWRIVAAIVSALAISLLICMVQLLPAAEAAAAKESVPHYGAGISDIKFYLSYFVPNYFDFSLNTPIRTNFGFEYLYIGAAAFFGLFWAMRGAGWRASLPFLGLLAASLILVTNPFDLVWTAVSHSNLLADLLRSWYFLAGIAVALAGLSALGFNAFLMKAGKPHPVWLSGIIATAILLRCCVEIRMWLPGGSGMLTGWPSLLPTILTLGLFSAAMLLYRSAQGTEKYLLAAAIVLVAGVDYKVFGTSLRMNGQRGDLDRFNREYGLFTGMNDQNYKELLQNKEYRLVFDLDNAPSDLRHYGLTTPQGGDPLMPRQYRPIAGNSIGAPAKEIDATRQKDLLKLLGVRYVLSFEGGPRYPQLSSDPDFRLLPSGGSYFKVFEFRNARLPYRWEQDAPGNTIQRLEWKPEWREFQAHNVQEGRFVFIEQSYPGWEAWVDGRSVPISKWGGAFQSISMPAGDHRILFRFRSETLRWGALISLLTILAITTTYFVSRFKPG